MKTSDSITKFAPAFLKAQAAITFATKDAKNPHLGSKYADLPSVMAAMKGPMNSAGIMFLQCAAPSEDGKLHLVTRFIHESGEWVESEAVCAMPKADAQGFGSTMTYLRRYMLAAMAGVVQDDDDGEGAKAAAPQQRERVAPDRLSVGATEKAMAADSTIAKAKEVIRSIPGAIEYLCATPSGRDVPILKNRDMSDMSAKVAARILSEAGRSSLSAAAAEYAPKGPVKMPAMAHNGATVDTGAQLPA